jgi:membrane associated rhomboid family serine protease
MTPGQFRISPWVRNLLIANVVVYVLQIIPGLNRYLYAYGMLVPYRVFQHGEAWRLVSYLFMHGDPLHLLFNMLALWMFGVDLEHLWGSRRFIVFYFIGGIGAALFSALMWTSPILGASGAVLAVLTAYAYYFPNRTVLMFFVFPVPVRIAVAIIGLMSLLFSLSSAGGIAHITHLGGIVVALAYIRYQGPVTAWLEDNRQRRSEQRARTRAEETLRMERYFAETIDPLLKKISAEGMEGLTKQERKTLLEASRRYRERFSKEKIIPMDLR